MDSELQADGFALASQLRRAGLSVDMPFSGNISKKLKRAEKMGAKTALLLGSQEFATNEVQLKSMETGETNNVALDQLLSHPLIAPLTK